MFCLFILFPLVLAELPSSTCDNGVKSSRGQITLTDSSSSSETTSCTFAKKFKDTAYFELQRFYTGNEKRYKQSKDSILGITVKSPVSTFDIQIHNDRIQMPAGVSKRCFGAFMRPQIWKLRIQMYAFVDIGKTVVTVASSRFNRFSKHFNRFNDCFQFEIDDVVDLFKVSVHGSTPTGMTQIIHNLDDNVPENTETFAWNKLVLDIEGLRKDIDTIRNKVTKTRVDHMTHKRSYEDEQGVLKESMNRFRVGQRDQLNRHSWTTYVLVGFLLIIGFIAVKWMKEYIRKRDKII